MPRARGRHPEESGIVNTANGNLLQKPFILVFQVSQRLLRGEDKSGKNPLDLLSAKSQAANLEK